MAFSLARVAGAGLRRSVTPVACSASTSGLFGKTCYRPSTRISDVPFQKVSDHFDGWTAEELTWARNIVDAKLADKGLAVLSTGKDVRMEAMVRTVAKELPLMKMDIANIKNKKVDVAAVPISKTRTINALSVLTLFLKAEEVWHILPTVGAWIKSILG